jgi:nucleoside phosphorylase
MEGLEGIAGLLVAAMEMETAPLLRLAEESRPLHLGRGVSAALARFHGRTWVVLRTGVGLRVAARSMARALGALSPAVVVHFGLAGAVDGRLRLGSIVSPEEVAAFDRPGRAVPVAPAESLSRGATWCRPVVRILSVNRLMRRPDKRRLRLLDPRCAAVDMESYAVARACRMRGIPCTILRAISDSAWIPLPDDHFLRASRRSSGARERIGVALGHPWGMLLGTSLHLTGHLVARRNAHVVKRFIEHLGSSFFRDES